MPTNKEILESIKQINAALSATIADAEKNESSAFYRESIKLSALGIFEKAQLLSTDAKPEISKPASEIKIIRQEINEPVIEKKELQPEPVKIITPEKETVVEVPKIEVPKVETKPIAEPVKHEVEKPKVIPQRNQVIHNEDEDDTSLNAKIAKYQQPVINVADKMKDTPIKELVKAISISKKFEFINELFGGNAEAYKTSLQKVETSENYSEASKYLEINIAETYSWNENEQLASEFFALVKRRFL